MWEDNVQARGTKWCRVGWGMTRVAIVLKPKFTIMTVMTVQWTSFWLTRATSSVEVYHLRGQFRLKILTTANIYTFFDSDERNDIELTSKFLKSYLEELSGRNIPGLDGGVGAWRVQDLSGGVHGHARNGASVAFENLEKKDHNPH
jgi:hypothetical protein